MVIMLSIFGTLIRMGRRGGEMILGFHLRYLAIRMYVCCGLHFDIFRSPNVTRELHNPS